MKFVLLPDETPVSTVCQFHIGTILYKPRVWEMKHTSQLFPPITTPS